MQSLTSLQMMQILRRTLNRVDPQLVGHGERVAVLIYQILKDQPNLSRRELSNLCLMGLLHDIGAYKTDEIDDMFAFERYGIWEHAAYGYLYLKNLSPLGEAARPLLFHHLLYADYATVTPPLSSGDYAGLLFIADRADMIAGKGGTKVFADWLRRNRETKCDPYWSDLFLAAEARYGLLTQLQDGTYAPVLDEMLEQMEFSQEEIRQYLSTIAYSIDFHSEFMVLHTVTTICITQVLAEAAGLPAEEQESLYYGALLHDLGKVETPVSILEKPGRLTDEEMQIMKHHVNITREILEGLIDPEVVEMAVRHHERQNGSGYPQGLPGEALTVPQRIVAVADVVSALIRRRSYKEAFDRERTLGILQKMQENGEFCGAIIDIVLEHYDTVVQAAEQIGAEMTASYHQLLAEYRALQSAMPHLR